MELSMIPFFKSCDENILNILSKDAEIIHYKKGEIIHLEEDVCRALEIIKCGSVSIAHNSEDGNLYTIKILGKNSFISPNNLYASDNTYFVYIEALTNTSIIRIPRFAVDKALENENFRGFILKLLSDTGKFIGSRFMIDRKLSLRDKITIYLKHQASKQNTNIIELPVTKTALANNFGVARTSLSRELQKMMQDGLIIFENRKVTLISNKFEL